MSSPIGNGNYNNSHHFERLGMKNKINQNCEAIEHIWCKFHCKIRRESGFLRGIPWNPLVTNGSESTLVT